MRDISGKGPSQGKMEGKTTETPEISPETSPSKSGKTRLPGRRVYFPEDDSIISGKIDAPNPWKDGNRL